MLEWLDAAVYICRSIFWSDQLWIPSYTDRRVTSHPFDTLMNGCIMLGLWKQNFESSYFDIQYFSKNISAVVVP